MWTINLVDLLGIGENFVMIRLTFVAFLILLHCGSGNWVAAADTNQATQLRVYIGTYTGGDSQGIYSSTLNLESGELSSAQLVATSKDPSFLAIHPSGKFLYAVNETMEYESQATGAVSGFAIDPENGALRPINQQPSRGAAPCHLVVDATGRNVLVANYFGGNVSVLPTRSDGKLDAATGFVQHTGSSILPRQTEPHAHSINLSADNRLAFVADLGLDKILVYKFDPDSGSLTPHDPPSTPVNPGGGPRHFAFHPNGKFAFTNNEITSSVTSFRFDAQRGVLSELQTISTLPVAFTENNSTAQICVHPSGKFVYVSNRGHNSIAMFSFDESTGKLMSLGNESTRGQIPRNFNIDPSGRYLLAANQQSHNVVVFRIDSMTGKLTASGTEIEVPSPVCIQFLATSSLDHPE